MAIFKAGVETFSKTPSFWVSSSRCLNSGVYAKFVGCNAPNKTHGENFIPDIISPGTNLEFLLHLGSMKNDDSGVDLFLIRRNSLGPTFFFFRQIMLEEFWFNFFLVVLVCYNVCTFCRILQIYLYNSKCI